MLFYPFGRCSALVTVFALLFKFQPLSVLPLSPHATRTSYHWAILALLSLLALLSRPGVGRWLQCQDVLGRFKCQIYQEIQEITILPVCVFSCSSAHDTTHPPMKNLAEIDRAALPRALKRRPWAQDDTIHLRPQMFDDFWIVEKETGKR